MKTYSSTYLYTKFPNFEKTMIDFIMKSDEIDKKSEKFDDIKADFKRRQVSNNLVKILESNRVVLLYNSSGTIRALKTIVSKDLRNGTNDKVVYVDCTNLISLNKETGMYVCSNINVLISYIVDAMVALIYTEKTNVLVNNHEIREIGAMAFANLFTHIIDYICKVSIAGNNKDKCKYMASKYYLVNILGLEATSETVTTISKKISGLSDREIDVIKVLADEDCYDNIKNFIDSVAQVVKYPKLTIDVFLEKWLFKYGEGTMFALEYFPAFSNMLTDAYVGAYINNQNTIEQVTNRDMVAFTKKILQIGGNV